jgi:hypothetical protein
MDEFAASRHKGGKFCEAGVTKTEAEFALSDG